jgi:hypothetical protein
MKLTSYPVSQCECLALLDGGFPVAIETHSEVRRIVSHAWGTGQALVLTDERRQRWSFPSHLWRDAGHSMPAVAEGVRAPVYGHCI